MDLIKGNFNSRVTTFESDPGPRPQTVGAYAQEDHQREQDAKRRQHQHDPGGARILRFTSEVTHLKRSPAKIEILTLDPAEYCGGANNDIEAGAASNTCGSIHAAGSDACRAEPDGRSRALDAKLFSGYLA
jgi:hypothetical protein